MNWLAPLGAATVLVVTATAGAGQRISTPPSGEQLEALTAEVASELRCPVCRQLSVQDSQAELSREVKDLIRERLAAGESAEEVKAYFVSKYGEWILLSPPKAGFTLLVWVLPLLALGGGGILLVVLFRRWLGPPDETTARGPASCASAELDSA